MKKLLFLAVFGVAIICAGCTADGGNTGPVKQSAASMRVAVILPSADAGGYWQYMRDGFIEGARDIDVDIKFYDSRTDSNNLELAMLIRQAAAAKVDAIAVQGLTEPYYRSALQEAYDKGILIAFVDNNVIDFADHLYVGTDNYGAGRFMAEKLIEISNENAKIAVIVGTAGVPNLDERVKGFSDCISERENMEIARIEYCNFDMMKVMDKYNTILHEEPSVDYIICLDGSGGLAFGSLMDPNKDPEKNIFCFDIGDEIAAAIRNGVIQGTVVQSPSEMGQKAIKELYRCFTEGSFSAPIIYTEVFFVDAFVLNEYNHEK